MSSKKEVQKNAAAEVAEVAVEMTTTPIDSYEKQFAAFTECVEALNEKHKELRAIVKALKTSGAQALKFALKQKPQKKKKAQSTEAPAPVPKVIREQFKCEEECLTRHALNRFFFQYLKNNCKVAEEELKKGQRKQPAYYADKACAAVFAEIKEGDIIRFVMVNKLMKKVCESDRAYCDFRSAKTAKKEEEVVEEEVVEEEVAAAAPVAKKRGAPRKK